MEKEPVLIIENGYDKSATQQQRLITVLNELEEEVEKQNSWQRIFARGLLYGLGTVIGATILIAIFGSLIALAVDTFGIGNIPVLGDFIRDVITKEVQTQ